MTVTSQNQATDRLHLIPYGDNPLQFISKTLLLHHHHALPRLDHITLLLPDITVASQLRQHLLEQAAELGHPALLGPRIQGWKEWLSQDEAEEVETVSDYRRELILLEALREHSEMFGEGNLWALADSLLSLFDELTLNQVGLPADLNEFIRRVASGYGLPNDSLAALDREAGVVHTLWHAWHEELHARGLIDRNTRHLLQLAKSSEREVTRDIYMLGPVSHNLAERQWLSRMLGMKRFTLFLHGQLSSIAAPPRSYHPEAPLRRLLGALGARPTPCARPGSYSRLLDDIYSADLEQHPPLRERAAAFAAKEQLDPLAGRLNVFSANSDEEEAHAVELQIRRWLLEGYKQIGIVTENRRLARRVRALLERADVHLDDASGWALSTTSAAAVIERWLQCVEEDFPYRAMLDLLKSPFFIAQESRDNHLAHVYRLEQDIVLHENIGSGIERYRQHLRYRQQRLPAELAEQLIPVDSLLATLSEAALSLQRCFSDKENSATELLQLLLQSLEQLGISSQLNQDDAGMRLLEELQKMLQAVSHEPVMMDWLTFRNWLGRSLERYNFQAPLSVQAVSLNGLSQSPHRSFDALVIAAVEREHLPGNPPTTPFFNDAVRRELGLPLAEEYLAERFYHFRRLLESAPHVLITHRHQNNGEEVAPSPWLELLQAFHRLAYGTSLADPELEQLLASNENQVVLRHVPLPSLSQLPRPVLTAALLPTRYSASAYQQLLNCPYQFFAARGLGLVAPEAIREALEKSDYGERVHRCLQAFHGEVPGLPGPYTGNWEERRRSEAIALLERISHQVFAEDLEDNFLHRGWLQRWLDRIPEYIDWQMQRAEQWRVESVERQITQEDAICGLRLHGRLDRCDNNGNQLAIVDYKTGKCPDETDVLSGEAIQLPFYALLADNPHQTVERVEYLQLDGNRVTGKSVLQEPELGELSRAIGERLEQLHREMLDGTELPAWGDEDTCRHCPMSGICRLQAWQGQ